jgi:hypothetical protein
MDQKATQKPEKLDDADEAQFFFLSVAPRTPGPRHHSVFRKMNRCWTDLLIERLRSKAVLQIHWCRDEWTNTMNLPLGVPWMCE